MGKKRKKSRIPKSAKAAPEPKPTSSERLDRVLGAYKFINRELIESIVIAFVLAFLFRTFEAEAFVIPTGSMANTLVGRHKDIDCPKCGQRYRAGASSEVESDGRLKHPSFEVTRAQCPNCGYAADLKPSNPQDESYPSYSGDRILVGKFAYEAGLGEPKRWDVAVFKFPGDTTINYIKRLVGLPGEKLKIQYGNLYIGNGDDDGYTIARKSPSKLRAMMQPVHDNDHVPVELYDAEWPTRWQSDPLNQTKWVRSSDYRSYATDGPAKDSAWLRYRHTLPSLSDWEALELGRLEPSDRAYLITDANAYNSSGLHDRDVQQDPRKGGGEILADKESNNAEVPLASLGMNWVTDLIVDAQLEVRSDQGQAIFELVDSGRKLRCTFDIVTGEAKLSIEGLDGFGPTASTDVKGQGTYDIGFANVDDKLYVWVDGEPVEFNKPTEYPELGQRVPTSADLSPVAIGAADGADLQVSHLKLHRDIYYISMSKGGDRFADVDWNQTEDSDLNHPKNRAEFFSDASFWRTQPDGRPFGNAAEFIMARKHVVEIGEDEFFMLGDNSAKSADGRLWDNDGRNIGDTVPRELMIGKALFIYWPRALKEIPGLGIPFSINGMPLFPNFGDMKLVR